MNHVICSISVGLLVALFLSFTVLIFWPLLLYFFSAKREQKLKSCSHFFFFLFILCLLDCFLQIWLNHVIPHSAGLWCSLLETQPASVGAPITSHAPNPLEAIKDGPCTSIWIPHSRELCFCRFLFWKTSSCRLHFFLHCPEFDLKCFQKTFLLCVS